MEVFPLASYIFASTLQIFWFSTNWHRLRSDYILSKTLHQHKSVQLPRSQCEEIKNWENRSFFVIFGKYAENRTRHRIPAQVSLRRTEVKHPELSSQLELGNYLSSQLMTWWHFDLPAETWKFTGSFRSSVTTRPWQRSMLRLILRLRWFHSCTSIA